MRPLPHFFRRCALKKQGKWKGKLGYPRFKTKKKGLGSFRLTGRIVVSAEAIVLPRLGRLRLKERGYLPTGGVQILSATVSEQAGHWYVSLQVEAGAGGAGEHRPGGGDRSGDQAPGHPLRWDGDCQSPPSQAAPEEAEAAAAGGEPAEEGWQEPQEGRPKLAELHRQIKNQRRNTLHQVTTRLAKTKSVLVIEDLNVSGMLKNHHLAQAIGDVGFYEFKRQLLYKAAGMGPSDPGGSLGALQQAV